MSINEEHKSTEDALYSNTFDTLVRGEGDEYDHEVNELSKYASPLGGDLKGIFTTAEDARRNIEDRWLQDLRQFKGKYDPEILQRMHPKRSKAFMRLTRTKIKTVNARLSDLIFPSTEHRIWEVKPTPIPNNPMVRQQIMAAVQQQVIQAQAQGQQQPQEPLDIEKIVEKEIETRAKNMRKEIDDQLIEAKFKDKIKRVIHSGNLFGTGILKGPLVEKKNYKSWKPEGDTWALYQKGEFKPFIESVPLWGFYPDMEATEPEDLRYVFERHIMTRRQLKDLAGRQDFNADAIRAYMNVYPRGNADFKSYEQDLFEMGSTEDIPSSNREDRYEVLEYWGYLTSEQLDKFGELPEELSGEHGGDIPVNVWIIDDVIIKIVASPIDGIAFPYHWYWYDKDETCIFGEGVASIMRDPQQLFNASIRAMLDNAAISAGPIIEANQDLLAEGEDPTDIYPFRVFIRDGNGIDSQYPALRVTSMPSYTSELMSMSSMFSQYADEFTAIPRYMSGESTGISGAGRTASGMSMLMGAANITLKDQVRNFDDGIIKPFITAMYYWNMQFNDRDDIKGDYEVQVSGSSSLIAKEVRTDSMVNFLSSTANPLDSQYVDRPYLLSEIAKSLDLGADIVISREQADVLTKVKGEYEGQIGQLTKQMEEMEKYSNHLEGRLRALAAKMIESSAEDTNEEEEIQPRRF